MILTLIAAVVLWYFMFVVKPMNFWLEMSLSILVLVVSAILLGIDLSQLRKVSLRHIIIGVVSAAGLYLIFYIGNIISGYLFPFKDAQILSVYSNRSQGNLVLIGILLLFIIGPGEEIYWRGFIQKKVSEKFGENKGYIIAALLYAGAHITTGNFMLIIAALVCGLYWGWLYKKEKSIVPIIISHALWDLTIFVLFPIK
jgi:membrane protease YdiL (CAAX protease family)